MDNKKTAVQALAIVFFLFFTLSSGVFAVPQQTNCPPGTPPDRVCIKNPISADSVPMLVNLILKEGLFSIIGTVALVMFIYGGFLWITAGGSEKKVKHGWDTMTWAALGLALIFGSYIIVQFLLGIFLK